jgi:uncharacterized surface protein with fasciclin (FAS1) repeats
MISTRWLAISVLLAGVVSCAPKGEEAPAAESGGNTSPAPGGQAAVQDDESQPNVVRVAVGSKDHTTLVTALQAANLVDALANAGPFTVFAPTNAAFDKLPKGTVETLVKPENKATLVNILYHHVTTSALGVEDLSAGDMMMVDGTTAAITKEGSDTYFGGAKIVASVRASNGWVHVVDGVVVPAKK